MYGMSKEPRLAILTLGIGTLLVFLATGAQAAATYSFTNFDGPGSGTVAGTGTNMNGIANNGAAVGFGIDNAGNFTNFVRNPNGTFTTLNINGSTTAMAFGINSAGNVVGTVNGTAFFLPPGGPVQSLTTLGSGSAAFGTNDTGNIVGQFATSGTMPGFFLPNNSSVALVTINAPSVPNTVNAQGINNSGLIVGFYVGSDGQDHGFLALLANSVGGMLTGTAIADPTIPPVAGEPGATFVFSRDPRNQRQWHRGRLLRGLDYQPARVFLQHPHWTVHVPGRSRPRVRQRRGSHANNWHHQLGRDHRVLLRCEWSVSRLCGLSSGARAGVFDLGGRGLVDSMAGEKKSKSGHGFARMTRIGRS